ncbi:MAG: PDDEXK nuclease domain-containing protein [Paludibacteraceae bacterium]
MRDTLVIDQQMEQEFEYVDSIINAHTNTAIAKVNAEALQTYWEIGQFVSERLRSSRWGEHTVSELADYLKRCNPKRRGYGKRSLYNMVKIYDTYSTELFAHTTEQLQLEEFVQSQTAQIAAHPIVQSPIAQFQPSQVPPLLCLIPYTAHVEILNRCQSMEESIFYMLYAAQQHLKVEELRRSIINQTYSAIMSKEKKMSPALLKQYPNAEYLLKDQVFVDFLNIKFPHSEPQLQNSLIEHMKQFVLELGKDDFIYIDREYTVKVGNKQKRIDLVFYHRSLQCLVAVELKVVDFEAEFSSKMDMYLEALDRDYKKPNENPSLGIILCPSADKAEVEYSINRSMSPTMVAEYNRILIPREVAKQSLKEYCAFLKKQY